MAERGWGMWSEIKLRTLEDYLHRFTTASHGRSREIVYLDLFAGQPSNFVRTTGRRIDGSPLLALRTHPRFTRLAFGELPPRAARLEAELIAAHPGDDRFTVYPGDSNQTVHQMLDDLADVRWAPTFAFIDPDGPDCHWSTLEALARHKPLTSRSKVELWILFPTMFMRQLPLRDPHGPRPQDMDQIDRMYGTDQWELIYQARLADEIDGSQARAEYINLMRWRLQNTLGYRETHPIDIPNEQGRPIYTMIFATDHDAGTRIMSSLYRKMAGEFPAMRLHAARIRRRRRLEQEGQFDLFGSAYDEDLTDPERLPVGDYTNEPPWPPLGFAGDLPPGPDDA
jgi:three-Cys-motif partner protein